MMPTRGPERVFDWSFGPWATEATSNSPGTGGMFVVVLFVVCEAVFIPLR